MSTALPPTSYDLLPMLQGINDAVLIDPSDRKYGTLLVGGQGSGKTSAMLRMYLNDIRDPNAAVIVLDPKPELAPLCLGLTPPDCAKKVYYLELGRPLFGMSPLRILQPGPLALQASAIADNIVASLLDIAEGQIFQSSRRYLYHAVIAALAIAQAEKRFAKFEDVYALLLPAREDMRERAWEACSQFQDLMQTHAFFREELPDDLARAGSAIAQRLDAPRNKVSLLTGVPPLRRFFNHTCEIPLSRIIREKAILLVDADVGAIGPENARACMLFVLRMLHLHMQRQVKLPEAQRPRVALIIDEANFVASSENLVDQIATHRAGGLDVAMGLQYLAQLGSGSLMHGEKIRKGVMNLMQSRCLFRLGDAKESEDASRINMAVYETMLRADPDSRARMRITTDAVMNLDNHYTMASWIVGGARAQSFIGRTYEIPSPSDAWAKHHMQILEQETGPYPEELDETYTPVDLTTNSKRPKHTKPKTRTETTHADPREEQSKPAPPALDALDSGATTKRSDSPARPAVSDHDAPQPPAEPVATQAQTTQPPQPHTPQAPEERERDEPAKQPLGAAPKIVAADRTQEGELTPAFRDSPVRRVVGRPREAATSMFDRSKDRAALPRTLSELAFVDRINHIGEFEHEPASADTTQRYHDPDLRVLALLDRAGIALPFLIHRYAMPNLSEASVRNKLRKLYQHGWVARAPIGIQSRSDKDGKLPWAYAITKHGFEIAKTRKPPLIPAKREDWRKQEITSASHVPHNMHALAWIAELQHLLGEAMTPNWRTDRYADADGVLQVPLTGSGRHRHRISLAEVPLGEDQSIGGLQLREFTSIRPDASIEIELKSIRLTFDLLVEMDRKDRKHYNREKFLRYDAFLTAWAPSHRRYGEKGLNTRPIVVFVCSTERMALEYAKAADEVLTGRIGIGGTPLKDWYYPGREHLFFAVEEHLHQGSLEMLALPPLPPDVREQLTGSRAIDVSSVALLPDRVITQHRTGG